MGHSSSTCSPLSTLAFFPAFSTHLMTFLGHTCWRKSKNACGVQRGRLQWWGWWFHQGMARADPLRSGWWFPHSGAQLYHLLAPRRFSWLPPSLQHYSDGGKDGKCAPEDAKMSLAGTARTEITADDIVRIASAMAKPVAVPPAKAMSDGSFARWLDSVDSL